MRFLLVFFAFLWSFSAQADHIKLDVCTNTFHLPPYYLGHGKDLPPKGKRGIFADALDETSEEIGLTLNWYRMPWTRCLNGLKTGQFSTVLGLAPSPEREKYVRFPRTLTHILDQERSMSPVHYHLFENQKSPLNWAGNTQFTNKTIRLGAPEGFVVTQTLQAQGLPISDQLSPYDGFSKLATGDINGFIFANKAADKLIELIPDGPNSIRRLDPPIWTSYIYLPIQKELYAQHPEVFETLWTLYSENIRKRIEPQF